MSKSFLGQVSARIENGNIAETTHQYWTDRFGTVVVSRKRQTDDTAYLFQITRVEMHRNGLDSSNLIRLSLGNI